MTHRTRDAGVVRESVRCIGGSAVAGVERSPQRREAPGAWPCRDGVGSATGAFSPIGGGCAIGGLGEVQGAAASTGLALGSVIPANAGIHFLRCGRHPGARPQQRGAFSDSAGQPPSSPRRRGSKDVAPSRAKVPGLTRRSAVEKRIRLRGNDDFRDSRTVRKPAIPVRTSKTIRWKWPYRFTG